MAYIVANAHVWFERPVACEFGADGKAEDEICSKAEDRQHCSSTIKDTRYGQRLAMCVFSACISIACAGNHKRREGRTSVFEY